MGDETEVTHGEFVSANYFDVLGAAPAIGRTFGPEADDPANTDLAVVISDALWTRRFARDPNVIGTSVRVRDKVARISGVMRPGFAGLSDPWHPSEFWMTSVALNGPDARRFSAGLIGRLRPGVSLQRARTVVTVQTSQWADFMAGIFGRRPALDPERPRFVLYRAADVLMPFFPQTEVIPARLAAAVIVVVVMVLLIATTNIAGLVMARGVARTGELAVRQALGARAGRIVRQLLSETLLLSLAGGALGLVLASLLLAIYRAVTPSRFVLGASLDWRVVLVTGAVSVGTALVMGLAPALQAIRVDVVSALGGLASGSGRVRARLRHWIVIPQVGLSLVLLLVAGVHVRALMTIESGGFGYDTGDTIVMNVGSWEPAEPRLPPGSAADALRQQAERQAERARTFYREIFDRVKDIPGAALADSLPVRSEPSFEAVVTEEAYLAGGQSGTPVLRKTVSPGYFRATGMSLLAGRDFDDRDTRLTPHAAVISESLARALWPTGGAIGRRFAFYDPKKPNQRIDWLHMAGIVNDVDPILRDAHDAAVVYLSLGQEYRPSWYYAVLRGTTPATGVPRLKQAVLGADPYAQAYSARTMRQVVAEILYPRRLAAGLLAASGLVGLLLASIGLYGVVSYSVAQRLREIGIRATLGAQRRDLMLLVIREGGTVALFGSLAGFALAFTALRLTANLVGPLPRTDLVAFTVAPIALGAVILAACYVPARRAAGVDPMDVLRGL